MNRTTEFSPPIAVIVLNAADTADVVKNTTGAWTTTTGNIAITGLPTIMYPDYAGYEKVTPVTEVPQVQKIDMGADVVVASTRYGYMFGNPQQSENGWDGILKPISATSPAVLTGTAATDKHNLYVALAARHNKDKRGFSTAYVVVSFAHGAGAATVGNILTDAVSGAKGIVLTAASTLTTVGLLTLDPYKIFVNGSTTTAAIGPNGVAAGTAPTLTGTPTLGIRLEIADIGNYNNATEIRAGFSRIVISKGFLPAHLSITTAGVLGIGQGTDLLSRVPIIGRLGGNLVQGTWNMATNQLPVAGATYNIYTIKIKRNVNADALANRLATKLFTYIIYAKTGGNEANFSTAIAAL